VVSSERAPTQFSIVNYQLSIINSPLFETPRLVVSEFQQSDASFILQLLNTKGWLKYIGDRGVKDIRTAERYIADRLRKGYAEQGFGFWKVSLKETGKPIGMCGLVKREALEDVDLGFAFLPEHEGKGFGYEAASATMKYAQNVRRIKKLVAITVEYNEASIALLKKLGFTYDKRCKLAEDDEELLLFQIELTPQPTTGNYTSGTLRNLEHL
jgi:RimJ/RimL family protein N-acetyltransferase